MMNFRASCKTLCWQFLAFLVTLVSSSCYCDSFCDVKAEIDKLPYLRDSVNPTDINRYYNDPASLYEAVEGAHLPDLDFQKFHETQKLFFETLQRGSLSQEVHYLVPLAPPNGYFDLNQNIAREHYVQKLVVPVGSKVLLHGDLHGDAHSVVNSLAPYMQGNNGFKLADDVFIIFLGDYVDKGLYGLECIYLLMRLKIDNPDRVFFVRGNHEDSDICHFYGFYHELIKKGFTEEQIAIVYRLYDVLPVALYLGSNHNFVQLCHGGIELGYLPTNLLNADEPVEYERITRLDRLSVYSQMTSEGKNQLAPIIETHPYAMRDAILLTPNHTYQKIHLNPPLFMFLGFLWNDFVVDENAPAFYKANRGFGFNKKITEEYLSLTNSGSNKLCGILRAHQHSPNLDNPMMQLLLANKGIAKLWSGTPFIVTFMLSPDTLYGIEDGPWPGFTFDTLGSLETAERFCEWTLN